MTKLEIEQVEAELVLWRVFGLADKFDDMPAPGWMASEERGPKLGDRMRIVLGDLPEDLIESLTQWRAQLSGILEMQFGGAAITEADRLALYERDLPNIRLTEFDEPYPTWFTIRLSRPLVLHGRSVATFGWVANADAVEDALAEFEKGGNQYLDGAVGRMIGALGITNLAAMRYGERRAMLLAPGRAPIALPRLEMTVKDSGVSVGRQPGYAASLTKSINDALLALPSGSEIGRVTSGGARWFCAARAEDDDLRRFVFAFAGLEALITSAEKASRQQLLERLAAVDATLPASELLWPSTNEDFVNRNLVFRFAAVAAVYSPATAIEDLAMFRELARARNLMFHGSDDSVDKSKSVQCTELLRRYLGLVATAMP